MSGGAPPAALKPIVQFVKQASTLSKVDDVLAYYVLFWAAQKGLEIRKQAPADQEVTAYLLRLLDDIESRKSKLQLPANPGEFCTERCFKAFLYADNLDREGVRTKATAAAFRTAALLFEALKQFFPTSTLPEEIATRLKYSVWRASHIAQKVAAGEQPDPPPSASAEEEELNALSAADPGDALMPTPTQTPQQQHQAFDFPSVPGAAGARQQPAGFDFPSVPNNNNNKAASFDFPSVPGNGGSKAPVAAAGAGALSFDFPSVPTNANPKPAPPMGGGAGGGGGGSSGAFDLPSVPTGGRAPPLVPGNNVHIGSTLPEFPAPPGGGGAGGSGNMFDFPAVPAGGGRGGQGPTEFPGVHQQPHRIAPPAAGALDFPSVPHPFGLTESMAPVGAQGAPPPYNALAQQGNNAPKKGGLDDLFDLPSVPQAAPGAADAPIHATFRSGPVGAPANPAGAGKPAAAKAAPKAAAKAVSKAPVRASRDDDEEEDRGHDGYEEDDRRRTLAAPPRVAFGGQPDNYRAKSGDIAEAQRHSKMAFSALNFDDVPTAVEHLCIALKMLTGTEYQIQKRGK